MSLTLGCLKTELNDMKKNRFKNAFNKVASSRFSLFLLPVILMAASASSGCLDQGQSFDFDSFIDSISNTVDPTTAIDPVTINNVDIFASEGGINDCVYASEQNMMFDTSINVYNPNNPTESLGQTLVEFNGIDAAYTETVENAAASYDLNAKALQSVYSAGTIPESDFGEFSANCFHASKQNMMFDKSINVYHPNNPTKVIGQIPIEFNGIDTTYAETVKNAAADYVQKAKDIQSVFSVKTSAVSNVTSANVIKP